MIKANRKRQGFTLIELMLSTAFIGILTIVMVMLVMHVTRMYSKGIAMKSINQSGREIGSLIKRDVANVGGITTPIVQPAASSGGIGRMCLGSYTYAWSPAATLNSGTPGRYDGATNGTDNIIVFARTPDSGGLMCKIGADGSYPNIPQSTSRELLPSDNGDYAIHRVALERIPPVGVVSGSEYLYRISYTIGTNDMGSINSVDQSCQPPSHGDNNFNFCSVNSFELILRAGR